MWTIWFIGVLILGMCVAYQLGKLDPYQVEDVIWVVIAAVLGWPLVIVAAIVIAPFGLPFYLGMKKKEKREAEEKLQKEEEKLKKKLNK